MERTDPEPKRGEVLISLTCPLGSGLRHRCASRGAVTKLSDDPAESISSLLREGGP